MKLTVITDVVMTMTTVIVLLDDIRLRRRMRVERLAQEAEAALGPPRIGDIDMPDPNDPRWKRAEHAFADGKKLVLALGEIAILDTGSVFIGAGAPVPGGQAYGKRVLTAYRRRLADEARSKGSP